MRLTELFEAAFWKRNTADDVAFIEVLDALELGIKYDPRSVGEQHPAFTSGNYWTYEPPSIKRLPRVMILYEIIDGERLVLLWNFSLRN